QYGWFSLISLAGITILTYQFFKKKIDAATYLLSVVFVPWFIFLNLTKTKIEWYIYPAVPQIIFLMLYPLHLLQKYRIVFYLSLSVVVIIYLLNSFKPLYSTFYSSYDENYRLAVKANKVCDRLDLLVDANDRKNHDVLQGLDLLISTSESYGTHPAMIYYFGKKLTPFYSSKTFIGAVKKAPLNTCVGIEEQDIPLLKDSSYITIQKFGHFYLMKKG
ncbi:MAG: hypothetical protein ABIO02_04045, partial [Patescibacteria group bacterium]